MYHKTKPGSSTSGTAHVLTATTLVNLLRICTTELYYSSSKANNSNLLKLTEEPKCYQNPTADVSKEQQDVHYKLGE